MKPLAEMLATFAPPVLRGTCSCGKPSAPGRPCADCLNARERRREVAAKLADSIPEDHRTSRFDAPELAAKWVQALAPQTPAAAIAMARASITHPRVVLVGSAGVGKTTLAVCMAREWARARAAESWRKLDDCVPVFASCAELVGERVGSAMVAEANRAPVLVLDDLGQPKFEPASSPIEHIVFARWRQPNKPTWFTTWMSPDDCTARYGDGITRRVFQKARIIKLRGTPERGWGDS